jgi:putative ABC transport system permease protein
MLKNYFKTAWRNLLKNKFYSLINIAGLTAGLAIGILILLWVQDELSFDAFHRQSKYIFRLENQVGTGSSVQIWSVTNAPIGPMAKAQLPEVKDMVRMTSNNFYSSYKYGNKIFAENKAYFTDPSFFSIFDFNLVKGNNSEPFNDIHSVVLTETTARRYFGDLDPIGKVIVADDKINFRVTGVIKDLPKNSGISGDLFFPMNLLNFNLHADKGGSASLDNDWEQFNYVTFLLLRPGTSLPTLAKHLRDIHLKHEPEDTDIKYLPFELTKMHLYKADGSAAGFETVRIFAIIALLILIIACINYVNLSTARSMLRSREVSLRKIVGAARVQLFMQFFIETALLFLFASLLAVSVIYILLPGFNRISGKELVVNLSDYRIWLVIVFTIVGTLAASSIYPAFLLSSFKPVKALKGKMAVGIRDAVFRKALVVGQFTISIALITGTIIIGNQLKYIWSKELGYDKAHIFTFGLRNANEHYGALRNQLLNQPGVLDVTRASGNIVLLGEQSGDNKWDGKQPNQTFMVYPLSIDSNYIPFFKLRMTEGHNFSGIATDSLHFILNETAVREAGIKNPVGKRFKLWNFDGTIIGVVKDFHFSSMKQKIEPAVFYYHPANSNFLFVKTSGKDAPKAVMAAESVWNQYNPGNPFSYTFLDDTFESLYKSEQQTGTLFDVFAAIAILISCLGLLGLAAYTAQVRTREIGVRKVLGASVTGIIRILAGDFIQLVFIAILIAVPIAWLAMDRWLEDFAYRTHIRWTVFLLSGLMAIIIALVTISFQSVKAALANPVKSLRNE